VSFSEALTVHKATSEKKGFEKSKGGGGYQLEFENE